jgi:hypothetical protein
MALFEYIAIAFSLVFSLTALRLVGGMPHATRPDRAYWVHIVFLVTALLYVINGFWAFWSYHDIPWTYLRYVVALTNPTMQYYLATVLVPGEPAEVRSWRDHYYSVRRRFFIGMGILGGTAAFTTTMLVNLPLIHPARLGELGTLAIAVVGLTSEDARVQGCLAVASLLAVAAFGAIVLARPAALG